MNFLKDKKFKNIKLLKIIKLFFNICSLKKYFFKKLRIITIIWMIHYNKIKINII